MSNTANDDNHGKINSSVSFSFLQSMHNAYTGPMERDDDEVQVQEVSVIECQSALLINT